MAYVSGNISTKYVQKYGTFTYLHVLDPEDLPLIATNQWVTVTNGYNMAI